MRRAARCTPQVLQADRLLVPLLRMRLQHATQHVGVQGKRKCAKVSKPAAAAKPDDSISLEDLADRMDVDWKVRHRSRRRAPFQQHALAQLHGSIQ